MIGAAVRRGIEVGFNTNGTLLTASAASGWLPPACTGCTSRSMGRDPETFAAIRRGGRLDTVVANLRELIAVRLAADRQTPHVQLNTVVMRQTSRSCRT